MWKQLQGVGADTYRVDVWKTLDGSDKDLWDVLCKVMQADFYRVDIIKNTKTWSKERHVSWVLSIAQCFLADAYIVEAIQAITKRTAVQGTLGDVATMVAAGIQDDPYRVNAIRILCKGAKITASWKDVAELMTSISSDAYRVDALRVVLQSCETFEGDLEPGGILACFNSPSYTANAAKLLQKVKQHKPRDNDAKQTVVDNSEADQVVALMGSATSANDWEEKADVVRAMFKGKLPDYWFQRTIQSGLLQSLQTKWGSSSSSSDKKDERPVHSQQAAGQDSDKKDHRSAAVVAASFPSSAAAEKDDKKTDDVGKQCTVCLEYEKRAAVVPCGHAYMCLHCAAQMATHGPEKRICAICRERVAGALRLFDV